MSEFIFRAGTIEDIEFIATCIIEAEKAGTTVSSYQNIFNISVEELRMIIKNILQEEIPGSEFCCTNYILAIHESEVVGGSGAWIEGENTQGSNMIRSHLFSYYLGAEKWMRAKENLKLVSQFEISRVPGALQFEDSYVIDKYRGQRVIEKVFEYGVKKYLREHPSLKLVQAFTLAGNIASLITMTKLGYSQARKILFSDEVKKILPGKGKIQWELDLTNPEIAKHYKQH